MKKPFAVVIVALVLSGCAADPDRPSPEAADATIRRLEERERNAVLQRDVATLREVWSERLMVNTPANQVSPDRDTVLNLVRQGRLDYVSFERRIEHLRIDGDNAFVMGAETIRPKGDSPPGGPAINRRFTHVWKNEAGTWRLVARHSNVIR